MIIKCKDCELWEKAENPDQGVCHRYPPKVFVFPAMSKVAMAGLQGPTGLQLNSFFPPTHPETWCGKGVLRIKN